MNDGVLGALAKSRFDIEEWALLLGVRLHPGQLRFLRAAMQLNETRWRFLYLNIVLSAGNRAGKTLALAILVSHHAFHKFGLRPPDPLDEREVDNWSKAPYDWYHFGIQQEIADLVWQEVAMLFEGRHPAQKGRGCPLTDALGMGIATWDKKERGEYRWIVFAEEFGGGQIHFRTTSERAIGSLGKDMHGVSWDECGLSPDLYFIVNEVLNNRRLGTGGQLILISTPSEAFAGFKDEYDKGDPLSPTRDRNRISLRMSSRDNIGYGLDQAIFDRLVESYPEELVPQNIDGHFISGRKAFFNQKAVDMAFQEDLDDEDGMEGGAYAAGTDPAMRYDGCWTIILKQEGSGGRGVNVARRKGKQTLVGVIDMIVDAHAPYQRPDCVLIAGLDASGLGGKVFREMMETRGVQGLHNVEFGGTAAKKMKLLTDLKGMLEQGKLRFPRKGVWLELRRQLISYRWDPVKGDKGQATDGVMSLAVAVKMLLRRPEGSTVDAPFDYWAGAVEYVEPGYHRRRTTDLDRMLATGGTVVTSRMDD